ncbi:MAG TPA: CHAD domain-containing protein [Candidatus Binatus sp.]|nr:CHAD domain-containing protein [Candidatus Binatus sp.]
MTLLAAIPRSATLVLSPDDPAPVAARAAVRFHLRVFAAAEEAARAGDTEPIHRLRVSTRRLRAALSLFGPLLPARFVDAAQRELTWLASSIGAVRDLDVLAEAVQERAAEIDPALRAALGPVGATIQDRRAAAHDALIEVLGSSRCLRLVERLTAFAESAPRVRDVPPLGQVAPDLVRPLQRAVVRAGRRLAPESQAAEFHRLRVRVKRLRYGLEPLRGFGVPTVQRLLRRLERLQDVLGAAQDAATQMAWLHAYARGPDVPTASLLPVGAIIQALSRRATKRSRRALRAWRKLSGGRLLDGLAADLARASHDRRSGSEQEVVGQ